MKFPIKDFFSKCDQIVNCNQVVNVNLVTFTEEIVNGKLCAMTFLFSTVKTPITTINNLKNNIKETNKRVF